MDDIRTKRNPMKPFVSYFLLPSERKAAWNVLYFENVMGKIVVSKNANVLNVMQKIIINKIIWQI